MNGACIRSCERSDLDAILAIEAVWPTTPKWSKEHFERELKMDRSYFCVCTVDENVAGYGGIWLFPPEAQVTTVAVRPDCARRGLGRDILEHLHGQARRKGCDVITLEVGAGNDAALALYRRMGYSIVGRRAKYYNDGSDALLMTCHLPPFKRSHEPS